MGGLSLTHWIILLVVVVLIFGTKKLRNTGRDLGEAVKGFKDGMKGEAEAKADQPTPPASLTNNTSIGSHQADEANKNKQSAS